MSIYSQPRQGYMGAASGSLLLLLSEKLRRLLMPILKGFLSTTMGNNFRKKMDLRGG